MFFYGLRGKSNEDGHIIYYLIRDSASVEFDGSSKLDLAKDSVLWRIAYNVWFWLLLGGLG